MDELASRRLQPVAIKRGRQRCRIEGERASSALIVDINGRGAFVETADRPPIGGAIRLHHREAGTISGKVGAHCAAGITIIFPTGPNATAFALSVVAVGMISVTA